MAVKVYKVTYREAAAADILDVYRWVYEVSLDPATAERFAARLLAACQKIGEVPLGSRPRDDLLPSLRTIPFEKRAVTAYLVEAETVVITNVFYGGRDYEALYQQDYRHEPDRSARGGRAATAHHHRRAAQCDQPDPRHWQRGP